MEKENQSLKQNSGLIGNEQLLRDYEERYDDIEKCSEKIHSFCRTSRAAFPGIKRQRRALRMRSPDKFPISAKTHNNFRTKVAEWLGFWFTRLGISQVQFCQVDFYRARIH